MQRNSRVLLCREFRNGRELVDRMCLEAGLEFRVDNESDVEAVVVDRLRGKCPDFKFRCSQLNHRLSKRRNVFRLFGWVNFDGPRR